MKRWALCTGSAAAGYRRAPAQASERLRKVGVLEDMLASLGRVARALDVAVAQSVLVKADEIVA